MRIFENTSTTTDKHKIPLLTHLQNGDLNQLKEDEVWKGVKPSQFDSACEKLLETIQKKSAKEEIAVDFSLVFKLLQEKFTEIREKKITSSECSKIIHAYKKAFNMLTEDMNHLLLKEDDDKNSLKQLYDLIYIDRTIFQKNLEILKLKNQLINLNKDENKEIGSNYSFMPMATRPLLYYGAAAATCLFLMVIKKKPSFIPLLICGGMIASTVYRYSENQLKLDKKVELKYRCDNFQEKITLLETQKSQLKKLILKSGKTENEQNSLNYNL